jgi:hypothetical protein
MQNELDTYETHDKHVIIPLSDQICHVDLNTRLLDIPCTCKGIGQPVAKKIIHTAHNTKHITVYNNCARTLFAAMFRQMRKTPTPNQIYVDEYHKYCDYIFDKYYLPLLINFDYNVEQWFNHLSTYNKQLEVLPFILGMNNDDKTLSNLIYTLFCKREKQIMNGKMPKNRAISACPPSMKFVMGPVIWALEALCKNIPGYKINYQGQSGANWHEIEDIYEQRYKDGFLYTVDVDGSAWDTCMKHHMKYLPYKIFKWLADNNKIKHVNPQVFINVACAQFRTLQAKVYIDGHTYNLMKVRLDETMMSGSPDTTWTNTVAMSSVTKFTMYKAGYAENQYVHDTSGDDSATFLRYKNPHLEDIYNDVWAGLGLIPKYIKYGTYSDITFCSTSVIPYEIGSSMKFKIVRQLDRMSPLAHWSEVALGYSKPQMKTYYRDLATSMTNWCNDMPMYENYTMAYKLQHNLITTKYAPTTTGRSKITIPEPDIGRIATISHEMLQYGYDFSHGYNLRKSSHYPNRNQVYDWLLEKHQITKSDIEEHKRDILHVHIYDPLSETLDPSPLTGQLDED